MVRTAESSNISLWIKGIISTKGGSCGNCFGHSIRSGVTLIVEGDRCKMGVWLTWWSCANTHRSEIIIIINGRGVGGSYVFTLLMASDGDSRSVLNASMCLSMRAQEGTLYKGFSDSVLLGPSRKSMCLLRSVTLDCNGILHILVWE